MPHAFAFGSETSGNICADRFCHGLLDEFGGFFFLISAHFPDNDNSFRLPVFLEKREDIGHVSEDNRVCAHTDNSALPDFLGTYLIYGGVCAEAEEDEECFPDVFPIPPDADESYEPGPNTHYFVRDFHVESPDDCVSLFLEVRFSGGFVAYLNGREWLRHNVNMGQGPADSADIVWQPEWVAQTVSNVWQRAYSGLSTDLLVPGRNQLAFVVHRRETGGAQAFHLNAQLRALSDVGFLRTPYLQNLQHNSVTVMWETTVPSIGYVEFGAGEWLERIATHPEVASTHHEVVLTGLDPDSRYFYRVHTIPVDDGLRADLLTSPIHHFRTAVERGTPFSFFLIGDTRTGYSTHSELVASMMDMSDQIDARFLINTGDLTGHASWWDEWQREFFGPIAPLLSTLPLYSALGNHEGNHETYYEYLDHPNNESWYEFSFGDADFFVLNTNTRFTEGSAQYQWLDAALAGSDASWQIAVFHHPPYSCVPSRAGSVLVQENLMPLFEAHGVDLVLLGHDHVYGRSLPIGGVTYVISGGGGASTYPAEADQSNEICVREHHYCILRVNAQTIELQAISLEGLLLDEFVLEH